MERLTPIQNQALCLLAAGYNLDEVAKQTGVTTRTISKWKTIENFDRLLKEAVSKVFDAAIAELVSGSREAAKELKLIIADADTPARVKVNAIQVMLSNASKAKDYMLEERLETLENILDEQNKTEED